MHHFNPIFVNVQAAAIERLQALQDIMVGGEKADDPELKEKRARRKRIAEKKVSLRLSRSLWFFSSFPVTSHLSHRKGLNYAMHETVFFTSFSYSFCQTIIKMSFAWNRELTETEEERGEEKVIERRGEVHPLFCYAFCTFRMHHYLWLCEYISIYFFVNFWHRKNNRLWL